MVSIAEKWPAADFSRVPYAAFTDATVYAEEQEAIFRGPTWNYLVLEAEIPNPGDFRKTWVSDIPIVVTRDEQGEVNAFVNRCAHRGAEVRREARGNSLTHTCVYHQWCYNAQGGLIGVPFRRGIKRKGGMDKSFDFKGTRLDTLRVSCRNGLVFGTFSENTPDLDEYLDTPVTAMLDRIFGQPVKVLGYSRQFVNSNWKLYTENTRDPYHASLLHLFHATFGLYRSNQDGETVFDKDRKHCLVITRQGTDTDTAEAYQKLRTYQSDYTLADPSLLAGRNEFDDDISLVIMSVFPSLVVQQIQNTLAIRHVVPRGNDRFELVWTHVGFVDDDEEMNAIRLKQANLIGPAGFISMEDGEACELVQRTVTRAPDAHSIIEMGGGGAIEDQDHLVTEVPIRGFWKAWGDFMGITPTEEAAA